MAETLKVDSEKCAGHGRCYTLAPDLFDSDEYGYPVVLSDVVPAERATEAAEAVRNCPERAISLSGL
jgi:ferredoxin